MKIVLQSSAFAEISTADTAVSIKGTTRVCEHRHTRFFDQNKTGELFRNRHGGAVSKFTGAITVAEVTVIVVATVLLEN